VANVAPTLGKSSVQKAKTDIAVLTQSLDRYYLDYFDYPEQDAGLEALVKAPAGIDAARYPQGGVFDIFSYGSDGEPGGEGTAADVTSWDQ